MALKITTQIGTDKGITSEAYVRIADYQVSKYGTANFRIELFQTESDSTSSAFTLPIVQTGSARNQQIGDNLQVFLTKEVDATRTVTKLVEVTTPEVTAEDGTVTTPASTKWENQEVEETYKVTVPDMSSVEAGTIFEFGYSRLKDKLVGFFGAENVIDC
jgi:hypothetical protein